MTGQVLHISMTYIILISGTYSKNMHPLVTINLDILTPNFDELHQIQKRALTEHR